MNDADPKLLFHLEGMLSMAARRLRAHVELAFPAIPALVDHYAGLLDLHFTSLGRRFTSEELVNLRALLLGKLEEGFRASPHSMVLVRYETDSFPSVGISYAFAASPSTVADEYAQWVASREPPLFGKHPDNKLMHLAHGIGTPAQVPCLDIGAGTGRNSLPLARRGHAVDALELTPDLADVLERAAASEGLSVRVLRGSILAPELELPASRYGLIIAAELTSHFRSADDLRVLFERVAESLAPEGTALIQAFVMAEDHVPSELERQLAQVAWSTFFTHAELSAALAGLPLALVGDESVLDYERLHSLPEAWPPTPWYASWAAGYDAFGNHGASPPAELRWLCYRRTSR